MFKNIILIFVSIELYAKFKQSLFCHFVTNLFPMNTGENFQFEKFHRPWEILKLKIKIVPLGRMLITLGNSIPIN